MPALRGDPLLMSSLTPLLILLGLPALVAAAVISRLRWKERARDAFLQGLGAELRAAGYEPLEEGVYRRAGRAVKVEAGTNPLFSPDFTLRLAAYSDTLHEFELRRGGKIPAELEAFRPILADWDSAGKMFVEVYAAGLRRTGGIAADLQRLSELAARPISKRWRGGTFTIREGFEKDVPQWHWRHDQRGKVFREARRWCVSCWHGDPYLNTGLLRLFDLLAGPARRFWLTDAQELSFLDHAFGPGTVGRQGSLVEFPRVEPALAADLFLDGEFFGGLFVGDRAPLGFEGEVPRRLFHETAIRALDGVAFYARRLFDEEFAWYSGEYEIVSLGELDVPGALAKVAAESGAQVVEIDRRFHKRIVVPREM